MLNLSSRALLALSTFVCVTSAVAQSPSGFCQTNFNTPKNSKTWNLFYAAHSPLHSESETHL
jgi:hypothetical protein